MEDKNIRFLYSSATYISDPQTKLLCLQIHPCNTLHFKLYLEDSFISCELKITNDEEKFQLKVLKDLKIVELKQGSWIVRKKHDKTLFFYDTTEEMMLIFNEKTNN